MYRFLKNPEVYHKAQAEVDRVVGNNALELKHIPQLKYLEACLRETLRVQGPISLIAVTPKEDTVIGNKYRVKKGTGIIFNLPAFHQDPKVWGADAEVFRPERLLDGKFEALPPNSFKPFGSGVRACIGRAFAEQEMLLATALILQRFQIEFADPTYNLGMSSISKPLISTDLSTELKSTLTVKPKDLKIKVRRRPGKDSMVGIPGANSSTSSRQKDQIKPNDNAKSHSDTKFPLLIIYGSNAGTCKSMAEDLEATAGTRFAVTVKTMDQATENLPKDGPVVIISPSYEGKPADNAKKFVSWLEAGADKQRLGGVKFSVFGVGNSEWVQTFHKVPIRIDEILSDLGADRIQPPSFIDVKEDFVGPWDDWKEKFISIISSGDTQKLLTEEITAAIEKSDAAIKLAGDEISYGFVRMNESLTGTDIGPAKMHTEVELPEGTTYRPGKQFPPIL